MSGRTGDEEEAFWGFVGQILIGDYEKANGFFGFVVMSNGSGPFLVVNPLTWKPIKRSSADFVGA